MRSRGITVPLIVGVLAFLLGGAGGRIFLGESPETRATEIVSAIGFRDKPQASTSGAKRSGVPVTMPSAGVPVQAAKFEYEPEPQLSPEEMERAVLEMINLYAAHPADPQKPRRSSGASDEDLMVMDPADVHELLELGIPYAGKHLQESPHYMFSLGRAAFLFGEDQLASDLLGKAAQAGSSAAHAYLSDLTEDLDEAKRLLEMALKGGFAPAREWLKNIEASIAATKPPKREMDFTAFNRPDWIRAFHTGDLSGLGNEMLYPMAYVTAFHETLSDTSVLFMADNRDILLEVDASLSHEASRKLLTSRQGMNEAVNAGMQSLLGPLMAMAQTRQRGGSIMDEVGAMNQSIMDSPTVRLELERKYAVQDARRLVLMYDSNPEDFRKVYAGMKKFIRR